MDKDDIDVIQIEYVLSANMRPTFLAVTHPKDDAEGDIQIIISCLKFQHMNVQERISDVFMLLNSKCHDIIKDRLLLVQAYSGDEMIDVLDTIFNEEAE